MGLFSRKKSGVPDIGQEGVGEGAEDFFDNKDDESNINSPEMKLNSGNRSPDERCSKIKAMSNGASGAPVASATGISKAEFERVLLRFERLETRLTSVNEFIKGYSERFSNVNQQIGEVRSMNLSNEKSIMKLSVDSAKAVDLVSEVHPDKLRLEYQKMEVRAETLNAKIESNKGFIDTIMKEILDFKRKSEVFIGTEGLVGLNNEVKKDLIAIQKLASRVKLHADKSEGIFMEVQKGYSESAKVNAVVENMEKNYSGLKAEIGKVKTESSKFVTKNDMEKLKVLFKSRIDFGAEVNFEVEKMKSENKRLAMLIEKLLLVSEDNRKRIGSKGVSFGSDHKIDSLLNVVESLSKEVAILKGKSLGGVNVNSGGKISLGSNPELKKIFNNILLQKQEMEEIVYRNEKYRDILEGVRTKSIEVDSLGSAEKEAVSELGHAYKLFNEVRGILESIYVKVYENVSEKDKEQLSEISHHFQEVSSTDMSFQNQVRSLQSLAFGLKNFSLPQNFDFNKVI